MIALYNKEIIYPIKLFSFLYMWSFHMMLGRLIVVLQFALVLDFVIFTGYWRSLFIEKQGNTIFVFTKATPFYSFALKHFIFFSSLFLTCWLNSSIFYFKRRFIVIPLSFVIIFDNQGSMFWLMILHCILYYTPIELIAIIFLKVLSNILK